MKYIILILFGFSIGYFFTKILSSKVESTQKIVTITCKEMEGYTEDIETGEKCLVKWNECDTIYNTK